MQEKQTELFMSSDRDPELCSTQVNGSSIGNLEKSRNGGSPNKRDLSCTRNNGATQTLLVGYTKGGIDARSLRNPRIVRRANR